MKNKMRYSPEALNDLDEIWEYIEKELYNPIAAENTINGIMDAVDMLKEFSQAGAILRFSNGISSGYRFVRYENYMSFYHINGDEVFIDRVIYGKRDYIKILFERK